MWQFHFRYLHTKNCSVKIRIHVFSLNNNKIGRLIMKNLEKKPHKYPGLLCYYESDVWRTMSFLVKKIIVNF